MPLIDFESVKRSVSIRQVCDWIGYEPSSIEGAERRGPCPLHRSTNPLSRNFAVNGFGFCCHSCGRKGDAVRLYAEFYGLNVYAAAIEMCKRAGIEVPYKGPSRRPRAQRNRKRSG